MNLDPNDVKRLASSINQEKGDSLAVLFLRLLELEHDARHQKKPQLVKKFSDSIDEERSGS